MKTFLTALVAVLFAPIAFAQTLYMSTPTYTGGGIGNLNHSYQHVEPYMAEMSLTAAYSSGNTTYTGVTTQTVEADYAVVFATKPSGATDVQVEVAYIRSGSASVTWAASGKREFYPYFYFYEGDAEGPSWYSVRNTEIAPPDDGWWFGFDATNRTHTVSLSGTGPWSTGNVSFGLHASHILYGMVSPSSATSMFRVQIAKWRYKVNGSWGSWHEPEIE